MFRWAECHSKPKRKARYQRAVVDPLLNDRRFQEKFRHPGGSVNTNTTSTNNMLVTLNPTSNKYCPPLLASRLRTRTSLNPPRSNAFGQIPVSNEVDNLAQPTISGIQTSTLLSVGHSSSDRPTSMAPRDRILHSSKSTPVIVDKHSSNINEETWIALMSSEVQTPREEELMRRSLSRVTLKTRVDRNRVAGEQRLKNRGHETPWHLPRKEQIEKKGIYLAIST
ncbi:unnamed protein product [Phytophthora fragariaefolia]|uniref:Unnamed protein product n=1 Tax=Phytophthora fragariaefolia TaxID=1490495 RepID=A0A9W7CMI0_9STRA|nr:unnamed protein product [Phytophthora fragariaefolia]